MNQKDDLFQDDNKDPVTRGDIRQIMSKLEAKMWKVGTKITVVALVGNQAINHLKIPTVVGFTAAIVGGIAFIGKALFVK